jgi:acetylxylan esterase
MDDAVCGGGDPNQGISDTNPSVSSDVGAQIKAMILMGNPRHDSSAPYSVGTATAPGVSPDLP